MATLLFQLTLQKIISNFLEPVAYLIFLAAVSLYAKKKSDTGKALLIAYFSIAFLLLSAGSLFVLFKVPENIWLYNLHALATVCLLGLYFQNLFYTAFKKHVATFLITSVSLYLLVKNLVLHQFHLFDSIGYSLVSLSLIIYVFMYFHQLLNNVNEVDIFDDFNFWLTSSFLIYFSGNFIIFLTYHYFTTKILATYTSEERAILTNLWGLHNSLLFVGALMLLFGSLWIVYRRKSALL